MAARIEKGARKEYSVWVDGRRVARRGWFGRLPSEDRVLDRIRRALGARS